MVSSGGALLKLIGAPNTVILGLILQQAILLGGLGYGIAWLVGLKLFPHFPRRVVPTERWLAFFAPPFFASELLFDEMICPRQCG
jgi:hypothetical protein